MAARVVAFAAKLVAASCAAHQGGNQSHHTIVSTKNASRQSRAGGGCE